MLSACTLEEHKAIQNADTDLIHVCLDKVGPFWGMLVQHLKRYFGVHEKVRLASSFSMELKNDTCSINAVCHVMT